MRKSALLLSALLSLSPIAFAEQTPAMKTFGQCLVEHGAVMYSAWWCPYCHLQLREFDLTLARKDMRDTETMNAFPFMQDCGGEAQGTLVPACLPKKGRGVPFWTFRSGVPADEKGKAYAGGGFSLDDLARLSGCPAPK